MCFFGYCQMYLALLSCFVVLFTSGGALECSPPDHVAMSDAFSVCSADQTCKDLYYIGKGGTEATMWNFMIVQNGGVPPNSADCELALFSNLTNAEQAEVLLLHALIKLGAATPRCPYDMVYSINPDTGSRQCVCPIGTNCRPACNDRTAWIDMCLVSAVVLGFSIVVRQLVTTGKNVLDSKSE